MGGFSTASLSNNDSSGMILYKIKNGGAVLEHGKPLALPLQGRVAKPIASKSQWCSKVKSEEKRKSFAEKEEYPEEEAEAETKRTPPSSSSMREDRGRSVPGFQNLDMAFSDGAAARDCSSSLKFSRANGTQIEFNLFICLGIFIFLF